MTAPIYALVPSPIGQLVLVGDGEAITGLYMSPQRHAPEAAAHWRRDPAPFRGLTDQLGAYFAGELTNFDVTVRPVGTAFRQRVWVALAGIPYGETRTYGELARQLGSPGAARAVGLANGRNPVSIVVPCHRVVGSGGALTGYGGGLDRKRHLLDLERRVVGGDAPGRQGPEGWTTPPLPGV